MKKYEAVFILDIRKADDDGASFSTEFAELIASFGGVMGETVPMGRKQFTYEIDRRKAGLYLDFFFELDPLNCRSNSYSMLSLILVVGDSGRSSRMMRLRSTRGSNLNLSLISMTLRGSSSKKKSI